MCVHVYICMSAYACVPCACVSFHMYAYVNGNYEDESIRSEKSCDELQESYNQTYNQSNIKSNEKFVMSHTKQRLYCISRRDGGNT